MIFDNLDLKDSKILLALDMNARKPDSYIAKKVGLSKQTTNNRIKKLQEKNIIKSFYPIIDHTKLGLKLYRIGLKLENHTKEKEIEIINFLKNNSAWIVSVLEKFDIWMAIYCKDEYEFMDFWNRFYKKFGYYIDEKEISLMTLFWNFERSFIYTNNMNRKNYFLLGKDPNKIILDETDKSILKELSINARQTSFEISKKIKETERVIRYRIKKLEEQKIILGYRPFIDTTPLELGYYKIFIQLKNIKEKDIEKIRSYIIQNPSVIYNTEALGGYDFELEANFKNSQELADFISQLKEKFPKIIKKIEHMEYIKEYKISYCPF